MDILLNAGSIIILTLFEYLTMKSIIVLEDYNRVGNIVIMRIRNRNAKRRIIICGNTVGFAY